MKDWLYVAGSAFLLWLAFLAFFEIFGNPATWRWLWGRCTLSRCRCRRKK